MPPKRSRRFPKPPAPTLAYEQTVAALMDDPIGVLERGEKHPLLATFSTRDKARILEAVERRQWAAREARRLPELRARLATWPVSAWGNVFAEMPELEQDLSPEQAREWRAWLASRGN